MRDPYAQQRQRLKEEEAYLVALIMLIKSRRQSDVPMGVPAARRIFDRHLIDAEQAIGEAIADCGSALAMLPPFHPPVHQVISRPAKQEAVGGPR